MRNKTAAAVGAGSLTLLLLCVAPAGAQPTCGPGAGWIPACTTGGTDPFPTSGAVVGLDIQDDGNLDGLVDVNVVLSGPTTVDRAGAVGTSIATEIVSMDLTGSGFTLIAGAGLGSGPGLPPGGLAASLGSIDEQAGDPTLGDSFFDVFFEIGAGGGLFLYNQQALTVTSVIDRVPPDATYVHVLTAPIPLFTSATAQPGQQPVAQLVTAQHRTRLSTVEIPTLSRWGLLVALLLLLGAAVLLLRRRGLLRTPRRS